MDVVKICCDFTNKKRSFTLQTVTLPLVPQTEMKSSPLGFVLGLLTRTLNCQSLLVNPSLFVHCINT